MSEGLPYDAVMQIASRLYADANPGCRLEAEDETVKRHWMKKAVFMATPLPA